MITQLADISITALCLSLMALWCWWFFGKLLRPIPCGMELIVRAQGEGETLEHTVRALIWLRSMGLLSCPIILLNQGLTPIGLDIAQRLCDRWPDVALRSN